MSTKKYEIVTRNSIVHNGKKLYKIRALKDFVNILGEKIRTGELGGYVESENNLSQEGNCWISGKAKVYDDAKIFDYAYVYGAAEVFDKAEVCDNACVSGKVYDDAKIFDYAYVYGAAEVFDKAEVCDNACVSGSAKIYNNAKIYDNAYVCNAAEVYGNAEVFGKAEISDYSQIYDNAIVSGDAKVCGVAKISGNKKVEKGKYIVKSLNIDEVFNEIKPICDKIDFVSKAINSNFPVEENYAKSLLSQFAEYSELADFVYIHNIGFTSKGEKEISELLLQSREMCKKIKVKIDK